VVKSNEMEKEIKSQQSFEKANDQQFTRETANNIYLETKIMIEELISEAQKKAEGIIVEAEAKAGEIIEKSNTESEKIKNDAYLRGLNEGKNEGTKKGEEEIITRVKETKLLISELTKAKNDYIKSSAKDILDLVMIISEKLLKTTIETKPEVISNIVKGVLEQVSDAEQITLKVNPVHIPYLDTNDEKFNELSIEKIEIKEDPNIKPGGCIVVTDNGFIDAQIDEQLILLKNALREEIEYVEL
jgi:flagellar assembly protein FliH